MKYKWIIIWFFCVWIQIIEMKTEDPKNKYKVDHPIWKGWESYSGFITVNEEYDSNLFFWYFPVKDANESTPWIIWLQGGPGVSSLVGVFDVNGPFLIKGGKGAQLLEFMRQFLPMFPDLRLRPLFVAGESYAGKYVPTLAWMLHRHQHEPDYRVNLKGLMVGNGLIDPRSMMHYTELCLVLGLLDDGQGAALRRLETDAVALLDAGRMVDAANKFNETIEYIKEHTSVNFMNFNADGPMEFSFLDFLKNPDVRESIHAGNASFDVNNQLVYKKMLPDFMNTTKPFVEELLEHYGVLCYSGQLDIILPYWGSKHLYSSLQWSGRGAYEHASRTQMRLTAKGPVVGYKKSGGKFTEVLIRNAGHVAPKDTPVAVKAMIDDFISINTT